MKEGCVSLASDLIILFIYYKTDNSCDRII